MGRTTTVVVGGGCSGALAAISLLHGSDEDVLLVDPSPAPGPGLAYRGDDPAHLLNSRAAAMSAEPGRPEGFVDWLATSGLPADPAGFASRRDYGRYLVESLDAAGAAHPGRLRHRVDEVVRLAVTPDAIACELHRGAAIRADRVVLALGHGRPCRLAAISDAAYAHPGYIHDPWRPGALDWVPDDEPVLLVGTGLTAVDVALTLTGRGHSAPIHAVSRHGLLPLAHHESATEPAPVTVPEPLSLRSLLRVMRRADGDWQARVDGLRPRVDEVWRALPAIEQRRFLRHVLRYWEAHRHRMAPRVAATVADLRASGALRVRAGHLANVTPDRYHLDVSTVDGQSLRVATVVNCTGPGGADRTPLGKVLLVDGLARRDPLRLGLDVDDDGLLVDATGQAQPRIATLGPVRRGRFWETAAVPEIRAQARELVPLTVR